MPDVSAYSVREWKKSIDTLRRSLEFRLHVAQLLPEND
jgi:hypothetical protein